MLSSLIRTFVKDQHAIVRRMSATEQYLEDADTKLRGDLACVCVLRLVRLKFNPF